MLSLTKEDYIKAEKLFNEFYQKKIVEMTKNRKKYENPTPIKISTITLTGTIGKNVWGKILFDRLSINDDIIYMECGKQLKGIKKKKKTKYTKKEQSQKLDKRKLGRGKPLSNQISIGINGPCEGHKNPICFKIFNNGKIQITGCKTMKEGYLMYEKIYKYIKKLPKKIYDENNKEYILNPVDDIITPEKVVLESEMINASYNLNFKVEQKILTKLLKEKYQDNEIFVTYDSCVSSPAVRCYIMKMSVYDERKEKNKQPSCFIYRSGSCNIIVWKEDMLYKAYNFMNEFIKENYDKIVSQTIELN
jgi:hypothetical protein